MVFKRVSKTAETPIFTPARRRLPRDPEPAPDTTVTHVVDFRVTNSKALYEASMNYLIRIRRYQPWEAKERLINKSGMIDVSECVEALMEANIEAITNRAGVSVGSVEVFAEVTKEEPDAS